MLLLIIFVVSLLINVSKCQRQTPYYLAHVDEMEEIARFDDAQHRGPVWYDYSANSQESASALEDEESSSLDFTTSSESTDDSSSASSRETTERKQATRLYRACTPCPHDMLKKFKNIGIKWICGGYQRARRSFKSECMMRYRNCQDGTMFVKMHEHQCREDPYHGKHFFYYYKV